MDNIAPLRCPADIVEQPVPPASGSGGVGSPTPLTAASLRAAVAAWPGLRTHQRQPMMTAINHAEELLSARREKLAGASPWSCLGLNRVLWQGGSQAPGLSHDAFRNMVSRLRAVLVHVGAHADSGHMRNKLSPEWDELYKALPSNEYRKGLVRFFRFLTLLGITPASITSRAIEDFDGWCRTGILLADPTGLTRRTAGNWEFARKTVPGWPDVKLHRPSMRDQYALPFSSAPASFNADVERFLDCGQAGQAATGKVANPFAGLTARKAAAGAGTPAPRKSRVRARRVRSENTIKARRWQIQVSITALVETGTPIDEIKSLSMLAYPLENPAAILLWHRERLERRLIERGAEVNEETLRSETLRGIGDLLLQIGRYEANLSGEDEGELAEMVSFVTPSTPSEMSEKNRIRLKALFEEHTFARLLNLSRIWLAEAKEGDLGQLPSARLAMYAAAIEILLVLPLRRTNLLQLRLDTNLRRPGSRGLIDEVFIPSGQVKNRAAIHWPIDPQSARILETYIREFRPLLAKPDNMFLFPGIGESHREEGEFSDRFSKQVGLAIGAEFNCHLARHFTVVRYLRNNPGAYEIAALILGHRNPETTRRFYCGLEIDAAARHVNKVLLEERRMVRALPIGPYYRPHRTRRRKGGEP